MQNFKEGLQSVVQYLVDLILQRGLANISNLNQEQVLIDKDSFGNLGNNVYSSISNKDDSLDYQVRPTIKEAQAQNISPPQYDHRNEVQNQRLISSKKTIKKERKQLEEVKEATKSSETISPEKSACSDDICVLNKDQIEIVFQKNTVKSNRKRKIDLMEASSAELKESRKLRKIDPGSKVNQNRQPAKSQQRQWIPPSPWQKKQQHNPFAISAPKIGVLNRKFDKNLNITEKFTPQLKEVLIHSPYIKKGPQFDVKSQIHQKVNSPQTDQKNELKESSINFDKLYLVNHLKEKVQNHFNFKQEKDQDIYIVNSSPQANQQFKGPVSKRDAQIIVEAIFVSNISGEQVVIETKEYQLQKQSFLRLNPGKWLNDEAVNAYVSLVNSVSPTTFAFNSFFFTKLQDMRRTNQYSFKKLLRIVNKKNVSLRNLTNILIPINIESYHWLLMNLNMVTSTFEIIDSMSTSKEQARDYVSLVSQFLQDYFHATKNDNLKQPKGEAYEAGVIDNVSLWSTKIVQNCTKQINGSDCGVHTCHNMRLIASNSEDICQLSYPMDPQISAQMRLQMQMEIAQFEIQKD